MNHGISMEEMNSDVDRARYALEHNILTQAMAFAEYVIKCVVCDELYKCSTAPNPKADIEASKIAKERFNQLPKE